MSWMLQACRLARGMAHLSECTFSACTCMMAGGEMMEGRRAASGSVVDLRYFFLHIHAMRSLFHGGVQGATWGGTNVFELSRA
jgi:hypothetical protein